jgi:hypothetical protein
MDIVDIGARLLYLSLASTLALQQQGYYQLLH